MEACGELIVGERHFPASRSDGHSPALVVNGIGSTNFDSRSFG